MKRPAASMKRPSAMKRPAAMRRPATMKRPAASDVFVKRPAASDVSLKRPAASDAGVLQPKREYSVAGTLAKKHAAPAAALEQIVLPPLAPVYHPSKRPTPKDIEFDIEDPPPDRSQVINDASFNQGSLKSLAASTPHIMKLHIRGQGVSKPPVLDFKAGGISFPELTHLEVMNWPLKSGVFDASTFPKLKSLHIIFPFDGEPDTPDDWAGFKVQLPDLRELTLECPGTVQPSELKDSTIACPKLEYFCLYKVYVESLSLVLPSAKLVWLHRMECLKSVSFYAPCVQEVRLQACYDLNNVKVLQRAQGIQRVDVEDSKFVLDVTNCCFGKMQIERLRELSRVEYLVLPSDDDTVSEEEEVELASPNAVVFKLGHLFKPPGLSTTQIDVTCGNRSFGDEIGVHVHEKVQTARRIEGTHVARLLQWGANAIYAWYDVEVSDEAKAFAKHAKVPLLFWGDIAHPGRLPVLSWAKHMRDTIQKARGHL